VDTFKRGTMAVGDAKGKAMYWYRRRDNSFWHRLHVPHDDKLYQNDFYEPITETQFKK
jgi:hypothetical protein